MCVTVSGVHTDTVEVHGHWASDIKENIDRTMLTKPADSLV